MIPVKLDPFLAGGDRTAAGLQHEVAANLVRRYFADDEIQQVADQASWRDFRTQVDTLP